MANRLFTSQFYNSFELQSVHLMGSFTQVGAASAYASLVNQALTYSALVFGPSGNAITIALTDPGDVTQALSISTIGNAISASLQSTASVKAHLTFQGVTLTAVTSGTAGNSITITLVDPGLAGQSLSIGVVGNNITANLATDGGGLITTTATQLVAAIIASIPASALVVATGSGASALTAAVQTPLAGGLNHALITTATQLKNAINADMSASALIVVAGAGASALTTLAPTHLAGGNATVFTNNLRIPYMSLAQVDTGDYELTLQDKFPALLSANISLVSSASVDLQPQLSSIDVNGSKVISFRMIAVGSGSPVETSMADGDQLLIDLCLRNIV